MHDQRLVTRLQNYWELICRGRPMPEFSQMNPSAIDDLWQQCLSVEVAQQQGGVGFTYRFVGDRLHDLFGRDIVNTTVNLAMSRYPHGVVVKRLVEVWRGARPSVEENQMVNDAGKVVKYRGCFLPFGTEAKGVTHLVVGFSYRVF